MRRNKPSFFIGQAFRGMFRNGMMTVASIVVLFSCLTVLGAFMLIARNIDYNLESLDNLNQLVAFCDTTTGHSAGERITLADAPETDSGRTFLGWTTVRSSDSPMYQAGQKYTVSEEDSRFGKITFYAVWEGDADVSYDGISVLFNASGMKLAEPLEQDDNVYTSGDKISLPSGLQSANSAISFLGWTTVYEALLEENPTALYKPGEEVQLLSQDAKKGVIEFYAVWSETPAFGEYDVIYDPGTDTGAVVGTDSELRLAAVRQMVNSLPYLDGPDAVRFVSKEETLENEMKALAKYEGIKELFSELSNPYPDTFIITYTSDADVEELERKALAIPDIYNTRSRAQIAESINSVRSGTSSVLFWFSVVLFVVSVVVIVNTVKLAVEYRSKEIVIMRYIGATKAFIAAPFEMEGAIIGLFSGLLSFIAQWIAYGYVSRLIIREINIISMLPFSSVWGMVLIECLAVGAVTGFIGSIIAIWRYLKA